MAEEAGRWNAAYMCLQGYTARDGLMYGWKGFRDRLEDTGNLDDDPAKRVLPALRMWEGQGWGKQQTHLVAFRSSRTRTKEENDGGQCLPPVVSGIAVACM